MWASSMQCLQKHFWKCIKHTQTQQRAVHASTIEGLIAVLQGADTQKSSKAGVAHVPQRWPAAFNAPAQPVAERLAAASNWRLPRHHSLVLPQLWRDPDCMLSRLQPPSGARPQLHRPQLGEPPTDDGSVPATQRKLPASFESAAPPNVACSQSQALSLPRDTKNLSFA